MAKRRKQAAKRHRFDDGSLQEGVQNVRQGTIVHDSSLSRMVSQVNPYWAAAFFFGAAFFAIIEGFGMPILWSVNYFIPSIFDGFFRRSLAGTVLWFFGDIRFDYYFIATVQFSILIALISVAFYKVRKDLVLLLIAVLYFISTVGGFLFHNVGHSEQLLYLISFLTIILLQKGMLGWASFSTVCALFVHEAALFITFPLTVFYIYTATNKIMPVIKYAASPLVAFGVIYLFLQEVSMDNIVDLVLQIRQNSSYNMKLDYYEIYRTDFLGHRAQIYYNASDIANLVIVIFSSLCLSTFLYLTDRRIIPPLLCFGAILAPLLLGFLGWDTQRWIAASMTNLVIAFYFIWIRCKANPMSLKHISALLICMLLSFTQFGALRYAGGLVPCPVLNSECISKPFVVFGRLPVS